METTTRPIELKESNLLVSRGNKPRKGKVFRCWCGKEFYRNPSQLNTKRYFCSRACSSIATSQKIEFSCGFCGKKFKKSPSIANCKELYGRYTPKYCSNKCYGQQSTMEFLKDRDSRIMASRNIVKRMDLAFSQWIRHRDTRDGYGKCCSCGQLKLYEQLDAGHFINRRWMSTRWREDNVHAQCISCNRFDEGNAVGYTKFMIQKYGSNHVDYLEAIKYETMKYTDFDVLVMIKEYRKKLKELHGVTRRI